MSEEQAGKTAVQSRTAILDAWKNSVRRTRPARAIRPPPGRSWSRSQPAGGALRAGVWTAAVLDAIGNEVPEFPKHVRYVTGASGGMVGAALFVTSRVRAPAAGGTPGTAPSQRAVLPTDSRMII